MIASARLLLPAVRLEGGGGIEAAWAGIERALELGVGGFILFGGEAASVFELTRAIRSRAPHPLLIASDLERGAGQQFRGATSFPPAAAIASLGDPALTREVAGRTAAEAHALGIDWILAPVADLDIEPLNPVVGTRSFGAREEGALRHVAAWIEGCEAEGVMACAKHFPGHGRTTRDSHIETPVVAAGRAELERDLAPFRGAIDAGAGSIMTAHVAYPSLDPAGVPATRSRRIVEGLLRGEMGFRGLVVTDALDMHGLTEGGGEPEMGVRSLAAGCDVLLHPSDAGAVARAIETARGTGALEPSRLREALGRVAGAAQRATAARPSEWMRPDGPSRALDLAVRTLGWLRGGVDLPRGRIRLTLIDDDTGGPHPAPSRETLREGLARAGVEMHPEGAPVVAIFSDPRAWKGRAGLSEASLARAAAVGASRETIVLLFGHPRLLTAIPHAEHVLCAWGGEAIMQMAVVRALTAGEGVRRLGAG